MNNWIKACWVALMCTALPALAGTLTFDTYYHNDHLGSPVAATDERSDLLWRAHFRPYGERQENPADAAFGNVGYTGHMQDADSSLVYMQARYYDPLIGRFLAVDPVGVSPGSPVSFNRYVYANDNPHRYTDPDGQIPLDYLVDGLSIAASSAIYARDPSVSNGIALAADVVLAGLPYVPAGIGLIRGGDKLADTQKAADAVGEVAKSGTLPKPPTGPGAVPKSDRDPKRFYTPSEREAKRAEQGHQCANGCGTEIDASNSAGHHIERHADGGRTAPENHAEVCIDCHKTLHSGD